MLIPLPIVQTDLDRGYKAYRVLLKPRVANKRSKSLINIKMSLPEKGRCVLSHLHRELCANHDTVCRWGRGAQSHLSHLPKGTVKKSKEVDSSADRELFVSFFTLILFSCFLLLVPPQAHSHTQWVWKYFTVECLGPLATAWVIVYLSRFARPAEKAQWKNTSIFPANYFCE